MCSSPHWQVGSSWFREKLSPANRNKGYRGEQISWKIVSCEMNARSCRDFAKNIALLGAMSAKLVKSVGKKWSPTCDRDISNSAIYTTAIYRAYTVLRRCRHEVTIASSQAIWGDLKGGSAPHFRQRITIDFIVSKAVHSRGPHRSRQLLVMGNCVPCQLNKWNGRNFQ